MPSFRLCRCGKKIPYEMKMCEECRQKQQDRQKEFNKRYDHTKRDKKSKDFYNSSSWEKTRTFVLNQYNGLDLYEYYINHAIVYAQAVHHIVEIKEDWDMRHDVSNLIPLTNSNHKRIHLLYLNDKESTQKLLRSIIDKALMDRGLGQGG